MAVELGVTRQATTRLAFELATRGRIAHCRDHVDRRTKPFWLTQAGVHDLRTARSAFERVASRMLAFVPLTERAFLVNQLRDLRRIADGVRLDRS